MKLHQINEAIGKAKYAKWVDDCRKLHPEAKVIQGEDGQQMVFTAGSISHLVGLWDHRGGKGVVYGAYKQPGQLYDTLQDVD